MDVINNTAASIVYLQKWILIINVVNFNHFAQMEEFDRIKELLGYESKMVIDLKDPNRPRFTLNELRDVLTERNELKTKLIEVEEELQHYKPKCVFFLLSWIIHSGPKSCLNLLSMWV